MAKDALGNITTLAEIALLAGLAYVGYKVYKDLFPDKEKPPGGNTPLGTVGDLIKTVNDTANTPIPTTGSQGQDFLRTIIVPKPALQIAYKAEQWGDSNLGGIPGYKEARNLNDQLVKSPLVQWNPAFPQFWGNALNLLLGKGTPAAQAATPQINAVNAAAAISQVKSTGFATIVVPQAKYTPSPLIPKVPQVAQTAPHTVIPAPTIDTGKAVERMISQSMGGTGSEIQDTPGILDYIRIGPAKQEQLDPAYRSTPGAVAPTTTYYKSTSGEPAVSSTSSPGFIPVVVPITNVQQPVKPITVPAPPVYTAPPPAPTNLSTPALPSGQIAYNWTTGQTSRLAMQGYNWITMSETEAKSRGLIK